MVHFTNDAESKKDRNAIENMSSGVSIGKNSLSHSNFISKQFSKQKKKLRLNNRGASLEVPKVDDQKISYSNHGSITNAKKMQTRNDTIVENAEEQENAKDSG